ncbi:MAG: hypothetical protein GC204_02555 [Chloroflexi bacterium]|nr:hypothetical protein [Chloroflexota bacterium]
MMRSEQEIRREVEGRLKRRGLLLLDGGLGALVVFFLYQFSRYRSFGDPWAGLILLFIFGWFAFGILHTAYVLYVEAREWLVQRAITREREFYALKMAYEKRKRDDSFSLNEYGSRPRISEDGELISFPEDEIEEGDYAQRRRNS